MTIEPMDEEGRPKGATDKAKYRAKYFELKKAIVENERYLNTPTYKTVNDIAIEWEIEPGKVRQLRHRMGLRRGLGITHNVQKYSRLAPGLDEEGLLRSLADEPLMKPEDRLRILSRLVRTGAPMIKITAIKAIEDLTRVTTERIGPPDPLSADEAISRLARLMIAAGKKISSAAFSRAFEESNEPGSPSPQPEEEIWPDTASSPSSDPPAAEPLPDLPPASPTPGGPLPPDPADPGPPLHAVQPGPGPI